MKTPIIKTKQARKQATPKSATISIRLDRVTVAKIRAALAATGGSRTAEQHINESLLVDLNCKGYIAECVFETEATTKRRNKINDAIQAIADS